MSSFAERLNWAYLQLQVREGRPIDKTEIGRRVSARVARAKPYSGTAASNWFTGAEPDLDTQEALAAVLGVDPGWLGFGEASQAPAPAGWVPKEQAKGTVPEEPMTDDVTRRRAGEAGIKGILEAERLERGADPQQPGATEKRRRKGRG